MVSQVHLAEEVTRFEESVRVAAIEIAQAIFRQELMNRLGGLKRSLAATRTSRRPRKPSRSRPSTKPRIVAAPPPPTGRKPAWTRDAIVAELATWLVSGTTIDAAFVTRHGPPGLVAATRKVFGRFDAALNVASLYVSKMYPDGPVRQ